MCKQREDIWRQRSGNAQTMIKKEAVIINCSEMRTEGTSRPSAGMFPPLHLCNSHHASSNQRITKSSEQRLNNNVIQRRREKYLAFESSCASPDAHRHQLSLKIGMLSLGLPIRVLKYNYYYEFEEPSNSSYVGEWHSNMV